ncbi:hypothetical protein LCGC14_2592760 [marine sediment metagenome]|uniref:Uncharacterized protein n=1 Tax=marine sediment metagenome TaxID=412755 RepID=A0A0F9CM91_9ZZZZ
MPEYRISCIVDECGFEDVYSHGRYYYKCPDCGSKLESTMHLGGLIVTYNSTKDNFTIREPSGTCSSVLIDCADAPDVIQFMFLNYKFKGWSDAAYKNLREASLQLRDSMQSGLEGK